MLSYTKRQLWLKPLMFLPFILVWIMFMEIKLYTWTGFSGAFWVLQMWQTKLVYQKASHEVRLIFMGCQSSLSVPDVVEPCNAISQLLHFNTECASKFFTWWFSLSLSSSSNSSGTGLIFTISTAVTFLRLLLNDTLLCPKCFF